MTTDFSSSYVEVQAYINGAWTSITDDAVYTDEEGRIRAGSGVVITRGKEQTEQRCPPTECDFTINNRDGKYVNYNPYSAYRGQLTYNTPVRVIAKPAIMHLEMYDRSSNSLPASAPDDTGLSITGDMELRIELQIRRPLTYSYTLMTKYLTAGDQRSWAWVLLYDGTLQFMWNESAAGTFPFAHTVVSTAAIPASVLDGKFAVRVQLDVNNGASGNTVTFYYSTSIDGTMTQLGSAIVTAGVSSIYDSTASVVIGENQGGSPGVTQDYARVLIGKVYHWRIYNNLTGTKASDVDVNLSAIGATTLVDSSSSRVWTIGLAYVRSDQIRFTGKVPTWPIDGDATGNDVVSAVKAYGLLQEINAGSVALNSPMYRYYSSLSNIIYVPMEDGVNATQLAALGTNARPAFYSGVDLSSVSIFNGSAALPNIGLTSAGAKISGVIPGYSAPTAQALTFVFYMDAAPSVDAQVIYFGGSTFNVAVVAGSAAFKFTFYDTDGATVLSTSTSLYGTGAAPPEPLVMVIELSYSAGTITWVANWRTQDPQTGYSVTGSFTKTMAVFSGYSIPGLPDSSGVNTFATGHIAVLANIDTYLESPHLQSFRGYSGETAQGRMQRLLGEMGYSYQLWGWTPSDISQYMGAQPIDTLSNILDQCLSVSRGVLIDCRDVYAVAIVSRFWLENQNNAYQVSYTDATVAGKLGIDDNNVVRNSVTITRNGGSSTTSTTTDGRYALTNGFAGYSDTFNLYTDDQTTYLANAIRLIGSWEDPFFTSIPFNFARKEVQSSTTLQQQLEWLDISFAFTLTNLPYYLPARPAEVLIEKYVEELYRYQRLITFQTSPARPYHTAQFNMYPRAHVGLATAKLHADITAGATTMQVDVTLPETITYPGSPIALDIGGFEKVTCTAVSGTSSPYTFTITRGTPAITHKANETVRLWTRYFLCY